jgi:hypothetical protein
MRLYSTIGDQRRDIRMTCVADLQFVLKYMHVDGAISKRFAPRLVHLGLLELCQQICLTNIADSRSTSGENKQIDEHQLRLVLGSTFSLTDTSVEACQRFVDIELHGALFTILKSGRDYSCNPTTVIGILFNVVQVNEYVIV